MTEIDNSWHALLDPGQALAYFDYPGEKSPVADFHTDRFNLSTAWWMAALCHAVYLYSRTESDSPAPAGYREEILAQSGFTEIESIDRGAIQAMLVKRDSVCILVFRGTDDIRDWSVNMNTSPMPWPGGGVVHSGFLEAFESIAETLRKIRSRFHNQNWYVTGHSQGAAMAILSTSLIRPTAVYTYGCPLLGDGAFSDAIPLKQIYQVINDRDLVTTLPNGIGTPEFTTPGDIYYLHNSTIEKNPTPHKIRAGSLDFDLAFQRIVNPLDWKDPLKDLYDHAIGNYIARLETLIQAATNP